MQRQSPAERADIALPKAPRGWLVPWAMTNTVREYDWGSHTALAEIQGLPASPVPQAELWMGTHPAAPSLVPDPSAPDGVEGPLISLGEAIAAHPVAAVGRECFERYGARLPYLLKILAIDCALSIQVHPDAARAAAGFAEGNPNYVDPYPKPEMLYAVTEVEALTGLRDGDAALHVLDLLNAERLDGVRALLRADSGRGGSLAAMAHLLQWPADDRDGLVAEVLEAVKFALADLPEVDLMPAPVEVDAVRGALVWIERLVSEHPGDPMVLAPALMHVVKLPPGGLFYVPAGVPHAYLAGTGVEIMSESDNVVRAGLTHKPIDVPELLSLVDTTAMPSFTVPTVDLGVGEAVFRPPVEHFELTRLEVVAGAPAELAELSGPQIVLCLRGEIDLTAGGATVRLTGGRSAFVPAAARPLTVAGDGELFRAVPAPPL